MFCCRGLEILIDNAGLRGISVLVYNTKDGFVFNIQSRSISKDAEEKLTNRPLLPVTDDENIAISGSVYLTKQAF